MILLGVYFYEINHVAFIFIFGSPYGQFNQWFIRFVVVVVGGGGDGRVICLKNNYLQIYIPANFGSPECNGEAFNILNPLIRAENTISKTAAGYCSHFEFPQCI